ncbi:MAG: tetratricopeptide repeat protein [Dehalococcoidia bacterium]|nr:tetratricopeptide repeat protein [Dehalococcoidia bacterium]
MTLYQQESTDLYLRTKRKEAVDLAMRGRWEEAVEVNRSILRFADDDTEAHNRLGKALIELGQYQGAKEAFQKALSLKPANPIARKNLERLKRLKPTAPLVKKAEKAKANLFVEERGKTCVTRLQGVAERQVLAAVAPGDTVYLRCKDNVVWVESPQADGLGHLEPRLGLRLSRLVRGGNQYAAAVTSVNDLELSLIIRETYHHPDLARVISFPGKTERVPTIPENLPLFDEALEAEMVPSRNEADEEDPDLLDPDGYPRTRQAQEEEEDDEEEQEY